MFWWLPSIKLFSFLSEIHLSLPTFLQFSIKILLMRIVQLCFTKVNTADRQISSSSRHTTSSYNK